MPMLKFNQSASRRCRVTLATATLLSVAVLASCNGGKKQDPPPPPEVTVAKATKQDVPIVLSFSGTLKPVKRIDILPRVTGYIVERDFTEGDALKEGAELYKIDPRPFQDALDRAQAQLVIDMANVEFARTDVTRYEQALKSGAVSREKVDEANTKLAEAQGTVERTQAELNNAELNLSYTVVTAPFDGVVQQTRANVGQLVTEERDVLTTLVQIDPMYVIFRASRTELFQVQELQGRGLAVTNAKMDAKIEVLLPDGSVYPHAGRIDFVSAEIDPTTDSLTVRGVLPNATDTRLGPGLELVSGQYVPVQLTIGTRPDAILIPKAARIDSQIGEQVFVVGKGNKVESRNIEVVTGWKDVWIIKKGVKEGEMVIVGGTQKVRDGMAVTPKLVAKDGGKPSGAPLGNAS